jgi:hypothetical protein
MALAERMLILGFDTHRLRVSGLTAWERDAAQLSFTNRSVWHYIVSCCSGQQQFVDLVAGGLTL